MRYDIEKNADSFLVTFSGKSSATQNNNEITDWGNRYGLFYVTCGRGKVLIDDVEYIVEQGQSFLLFPHTKILLSVYNDEPFEYKWVEFMGSILSWIISQTLFSRSNPVLPEFPTEDIERYFDFDTINSNALYTTSRNNGKFLELLSYYLEYFPYTLEKDADYVLRARDYIQRNYYNTELSVQSVADYIKIDRTYLYRLFKQVTGKSVIEYINECRLSKARMMLINRSVSIKDIANNAGFSDQMYFSRLFKKHTGKTPSEYRKSLRNHYGV